VSSAPSDSTPETVSDSDVTDDWLTCAPETDSTLRQNLKGKERTKYLEK
jgi:hypothetical protein